MGRQPKFTTFDTENRIESTSPLEISAIYERSHYGRSQSRDEIGLEDDKIGPVRRLFGVRVRDDVELAGHSWLGRYRKRLARSPWRSMKVLMDSIAARFSSSQRFSCSALTNVRRRRSSVSERLMRRRLASSSNSASTNRLTALFLGTRWLSIVGSSYAHTNARTIGSASPIRDWFQKCSFLPGSADRDAVHAQGGLADTDGDALAVLAAGADAGVELEVVADHADALQVGRAVADQHGALERRADLAVLDPVGLGAVEHVLARRDVHLAAAEIYRIDAVLHRRDDLARRVGSGQHIGVGHARHRNMRMALAPSIAGRAHVHEPGILPVLHVTDQNAVLDQHGAVRRGAFVVDRQRPAPLRDGAVVHHRHAGGGDALAHQPGEGGCLLPVEIAFEAVPDRLVQHHARPAGTEHHVHFAGRRRHGFEIDQCLAYGLVDGVMPGPARHETGIAFAPAIAVGP